MASPAESPASSPGDSAPWPQEETSGRGPGAEPKTEASPASSEVSSANSPGIPHSNPRELRRQRSQCRRFRLHQNVLCLAGRPSRRVLTLLLTQMGPLSRRAGHDSRRAFGRKDCLRLRPIVLVCNTTIQTGHQLGSWSLAGGIHCGQFLKKVRVTISTPSRAGLHSRLQILLHAEDCRENSG